MNQRQYLSLIQDTLRQLEHLLKNTPGSPISNGLKLRIDNALFKQDATSPNISHLTPLEELELISELSNHLRDQKHEYIRYRIFDAFFSMDVTSDDNRAVQYRRDVLCRFVSFCLSMGNAAVLECAALWMKTSERQHAMYLVSSLIKDFCQVQIEGSRVLKSCLQISPRFCCVFLTAATAKYPMICRDKHTSMEVDNCDNTTDNSDDQWWPNINIIDVAQHWLINDPTVCFVTITQMDKLWRTVMKATASTLQNSLPLTPHAGICEWCVKTPFAPPSILSEKIESSDNLEYYQLHSRLQYGFLKSLLVSKPAVKAITKGSVLGNPDLQLLSRNEINVLVGDLMSLCKEENMLSTTTDSSNSRSEVAVNRFAQIAQVGIQSRVMACTTDQFQSLSDPLPTKTRLLEIVAYGGKRKRSTDDDQQAMDHMVY